VCSSRLIASCLQTITVRSLAKQRVRWATIGERVAGLPIGFIAGEHYAEQSVHLDDGDIVLTLSDGVTDVFPPVMSSWTQRVSWLSPSRPCPNYGSLPRWMVLFKHCSIPRRVRDVPVIQARLPDGMRRPVSRGMR
jgi:Stage II sporulation protein E (SpoIIE)